ncbi:MAG TPA: CRISPR-associated endonuclease Cas3'', partial [bacterium]|nr:CRISPR-associated endonuclease Cas3'' [bacterium]
MGDDSENAMKFLAHSASDTGHVDSVRSHLSEVARCAAEFAGAFGAQEEARNAGLLHDLGKYGDLFQKRLRHETSGVDHWSLGAFQALMHAKALGIASALAIQGHHIGLQWASQDSLRNLSPEFLMQGHPLGLRIPDESLSVLLKRFEDDGLALSKIDASVFGYSSLCSECADAMLDVRMLFSTLVDADFIETEAHFQATDVDHKCYRRKGLPLEPKTALDELMMYLDHLRKSGTSSLEIQRVRDDLLQACLCAAEQPSGIFTLTAPTGSGKTLSMMAFALRHALEHNLSRIIVVIPYLSIIEQNVAVYQQVFSRILSEADLKQYVLEHHSMSGTREGEEAYESQGRLLSENWDAPIVVTTSVQFLESLFSNRPGA